MAHRRLHRNLSCRHFGSMSWSCAESSGTGSDWGRSESKSESSSQAPERRGSEGLNCVAACSGRSSVRIRRRRGGRMPRTKTWCGEDRRRVSLGARNYLRRGAAGTHLTTQKSPQASCTRLEPPLSLNCGATRPSPSSSIRGSSHPPRAARWGAHSCTSSYLLVH